MGKSAAISHEPGNHHRSRAYARWYKHWYQGDLVEARDDYIMIEEASCNRTRGGNPVGTIAGTSTKWRDPSIYERSVLTIEQTSGQWTTNHAGDHVESAFGPCEPAVINDAQNPPIFDVRIPTVVWSDYLANEALTKAILKIKDMKAGMGENLGQAKQTYKMLYGSGVKLLEAALALKRGNLRQVWGILGDSRSAVKAGANIFLEYKYGWKPLMSDIYGLKNLLAQQLKPAQLFSAYASAREDMTIFNTFGMENTGSGWRSCRCKLYGKLNNENSHLLDQVGLSNPLSIAWQLVPYSFVVDWFIPVGDVLDAMQAPLGVDFVGGTLTMVGNIEATSHWLPFPGWSEDSPRRAYYSGWSMRRHALTGAWPSPGFYAKSPFSNSHGQSAIALLLQKLGRR